MLLGTLLAVPSASSVGLQMPPRITTQPRSVLASAGNESVVFARAYGAGQLSFQWLREGVPMDGAEEPVLRLGSTSAGQAGAYQLVVSNPYGKATSDVARVTMEADGGAGFTPAGLVFCVNAVGYVNVTLQPGLSLVVNPFFVGGMAAVSNVLGPLPNGMAIYQVTSSGFTANAMLSQWTRPDALLPLGEGFFALNPFSFPVTITMVGEVAQGDLQQVLPAAYSIAASLVPQAGGVGSALGMPVAKGDEVWRWDSQTQSYLQYVFPEDAWQPQEPMISVAESFVVRKTATTLWRRIFQVNLLGWCPPPFPSPLSRVPMVSSAGQLHFFTYNPDPALGRVEGVGSDYFGQLYAGLSTNESELMPCGVPVRFFDGERTGYLDGGIVTTGLPAGRDVQVQLRIWRALDGASYEEAAATGCFTSKSELVTARTEAPLVDGQPGKPPRPLNHFRTLRPPQVPGIAIEPANGLVPIGQAATLTAVGAGPGTPSFQWSRNGQSIPNANGPQLVLSNMQRNDAGQYSVTIGNQTCASVSASVQLTVYEPIQILEQPADLDRIAGEMAPFAVLATGEPPLTYSWRTSALDPGLTNRLLNVNAAALVLSNVVDEAEGEYWVEIRSPYETIATSHARLSVTNFLHIALDTPAWRYVTGGDQAWQLTEATYLGRSNIAVAGPIPWSSSARMHAQFEGPGVMNFWWATTARNNELQFLVDGVAKTSLNNRPG